MRNPRPKYLKGVAPRSPKVPEAGVEDAAGFTHSFGAIPLSYPQRNVASMPHRAPLIASLRSAATPMAAGIKPALAAAATPSI
jgi:hypothetical protein